MSSDASSSLADTDIVLQEKFLQACEEENIEAMVELIDSSEETSIRTSINWDKRKESASGTNSSLMRKS